MGEPIVTYRFFEHSLRYYTGYQIIDSLDDMDSLQRFVRAHKSTLVVTNPQRLGEILDVGRFSVALLAQQGDCRLLRLATRN